MYKRIKTQQGIGGLKFVDRYVWYTLKEMEYKLTVKDISTLKDVFVTDEENVNACYLYKDYLAYVSMGEEETHLIDLKTLKKGVINEALCDLLPGSFVSYKNLYYKVNENDLVIYDLITGDIISKIAKKIEGYIYLNREELIITANEESSYIYCYEKAGFDLLWHRDIKDIFSAGPNIMLRNHKVHLYKDSLIVLTDAGTVRLNLSDGNLIWKTNDYARTMEIVNNVGYVCTSGSLYKINLDDGVISGYGKEYNSLHDFEYKGKLYWASGHQVVYHEGLLWYSVYSSGCSFLIAINPYDGHYEWMHYVDTYERTDEPIFHGNNMFLRDSGSNLHIYEKDALENDTDFKKYFKVIE